MMELKDTQVEVMGISQDIKVRLDSLREIAAAYSKDNEGSPSCQLLHNMLADYSRNFRNTMLDFREYSECFEKELRGKILRQAKISMSSTDAECDLVSVNLTERL